MKKEPLPLRPSLICPKCDELYSEYPALSRVDNKTQICPNCATKEALGAHFAAQIKNCSYCGVECKTTCDTCHIVICESEKCWAEHGDYCEAH